jgi:hypothetical protein
MLHAKMLGFGHPKTEERVRAMSPLPADFAAVLDELRRGQKKRPDESGRLGSPNFSRGQAARDR